MHFKIRHGQATTTALLSIAAASLLATSAAAHTGDHWPIAGNALKMGWTPNGSGTKFSFKTKGQVNINPVSIGEDPTVERSTLLVRGSGAAPGSTGLIELDASRWEPIGPAEAPRGWKFKGDPYYTDGVTKIILKSGKTDGSLQIQAKSYYWPFQINGPQDSVEIMLTIGGFAYCAEFSADRLAEFKSNGIGQVQASFSLAPAECPQVCGNGILEDGEQCDDGNTVDGDTCTNTCQGCDPAEAEFTSTYEGIQELIFDNPVYACSNDTCHGTAAQGGLDLRAGFSHADLVNVPSAVLPTTARVFPGDQDLSMLYLKIAERTLGNVDAPGTAMSPLATVTEEHLEALRLWIRGGAPETGVVAGTAELLGSCLPAPTPLDIPQPPVPDPSVGTQFAMPGYTLYSQDETEGCVASYYDVSQTVPPGKMVPCPGAFPGTNETGPNAGMCFSYSSFDLFQDAQSHHSIIHIYPGQYSWNDPGWGGWRCYGGPTPGATCNPETTNACGTDGVCGSKFHDGVACLDTITQDWGSPDFNASSSPTFSGSQESTAQQHFPTGVYGLLPLKGLIVWNSHAFNLTTQDTEMEAWLNMTYTDQRSWPAQALFNDNWIFTQNVPPFEQREYCATHTFAEGTNLFQLSSHTHSRGIRWRYYDAPQTPCPAPGAFTSPSCLPGAPGDVFYESYDYSDALTLNYDTPKVFSGTVANRTIKFCALYDNGFLNPDTVKTQSGSPNPTGNLIIGGPCSNSEVKCMGGPNKGQLCGGNDANCPGSVCDACPLRGGVTTQDEMFIATGTYFLAP
jgi:cysteine-rich repeat protein